MNDGDLGYVPQGVVLVKHGTERYTSPVGFFKTHKPISVVVLEEKSDLWLNIYYKGEKWSIMKNEIYPLEEESVS
jgi:hypothetical protein|tara:strand:- start:1755 stop:1979 length:225 start_codon:yes stop_codon:yes gene_type:complete